MALSHGQAVDVHLVPVGTKRKRSSGWLRSKRRMHSDLSASPVPAQKASLVRLGNGDVREPVAYEDPDDSGPYHLIGRHGSLTEAEMLVPLLATRA